MGRSADVQQVIDAGDENTVAITFSAEQAQDVRVTFAITLSENLIREQHGAVAVAVAARVLSKAILEHAAKLSGVPSDAQNVADVRALVDGSRDFRRGR